MLAQPPRRVAFSPLRRLRVFGPHHYRASTIRRRGLVLVVVPLLVFLAYVHRDAVVSTFIQPFINAYMERYDFVPTEAERACLGLDAGLSEADDDGQASANRGSGAEIPNVVHFIWNPGHAPEAASSSPGYTPPDIPFTFALAIRAAHASLRPDRLKLHHSHALPSVSPNDTTTTSAATHPNWHAALPFVTDLVHHDVGSYLAPSLFPRLRRRDEDDRKRGRRRHVWDPAHAADVLRLHVLLEEGGVYLDTDAFALRPLPDALMRRAGGGSLSSPARRRRRPSNGERTAGKSWDDGDGVEGSESAAARGRRSPPPAPAEDDGDDPGVVVMGHEGGFRYGLGNGVLLASRNATFLRRWLAEYRATYDGQGPWNYHSVRLPKLLSRSPPSPSPKFQQRLGSGRGGKHEERNGLAATNGVCVLPPESFFWPLWTPRHVAWMHEPLSSRRHDHGGNGDGNGSDEVDSLRMRLARFDGALYERQWVYSAWNHAAGRYLKPLTREKVLEEDTRFNVMMRRFLLDDDEV